jgi:predicted RNase H-like HicB family nuclease
VVATYEVEVRISPWEDGGFIAEALGLQGCWAVADTIDQAIDDIRDVIQMWVRVRQTHGLPLPPTLHNAEEGVAIRAILPVAVA